MREQHTREEAEITIGNVKREYAKKEKILISKIKKTEECEAKASNLIENFEAKIKEEALIQILEQTDKLQKVYKSKIHAIYGVTIGALAYSFLTTAFTACLSERFSSDLIQFIDAIWSFISNIFDFAISGAGYTWLLKDVIPFKFVNVVVASILAVIVFILLVVFWGGCLYFACYKIYQFYKKEVYDLISLAVSLISMAILVWFADALSFISWNLVLIWILIQALYALIVKMFLTTNKNNYYL